MGSVFSSLFWWWNDKKYRILILGLDNAGKTTLLYKLYLGKTVVTNPTIGSNVQEIQYKNLTMVYYDLGGQESLRKSWSIYFSGCNAIVLVIDSSDSTRLPTVKNELFQILAHSDLKDSKLLVYANKQDKKDALGPSEITKALNLHKIKTHDWSIFGCCALTGEGLKPGMEWLHSKLSDGPSS